MRGALPPSLQPACRACFAAAPPGGYPRARGYGLTPARPPPPSLASATPRRLCKACVTHAVTERNTPTASAADVVRYQKQLYFTILYWYKKFLKFFAKILDKRKLYAIIITVMVRVVHKTGLLRRNASAMTGISSVNPGNRWTNLSLTPPRRDAAAVDNPLSLISYISHPYNISGDTNTPRVSAPDANAPHKFENTYIYREEIYDYV